MFDGVMRSSFNTLNCPQVHVRNVNKRRALRKTRTDSSLAIQVSSTVLQTEEGGESTKLSQVPGSFLSGERCRIPVGIIGGVSVVSTLIFLEKLVWWSSRSGGESASFIVCNDPAITRLRHPSTDSDQKGIDHYDRYSVIENLRQKRVFLEQSGVRCIVMPCHVSHLWHREVSLGCSVPFLNIGDCVARELKEAKFRPLEAGSCVQIGVLANSSSSTAAFYKKKLQSQGFEVVLPDNPTMEHAVLPAIEALQKKDVEGAQNLLRIAIHLLLMSAVNTIILAADELRNILPPNDPLLKRCVDPMDALVRSTISRGRTSQKAVYHKKN
ncbi:hypothetical protein DCAR_0415966 [Daucus carota subsp. sativus]|nr:hypothetical protein DCAR_0415966 [Daucus carota subsp. sativus]